MNKFKEIIRIYKENAPNKPKKNVMINAQCLYPFTDMIIFPDGKVGLCCNDCFELTDYGNVMEESLTTIWGSKRFRKLCNVMKNGRNFPFCVECDVMDAGERERTIKKIMKENNIK